MTQLLLRRNMLQNVTKDVTLDATLAKLNFFWKLLDMLTNNKSWQWGNMARQSVLNFISSCFLIQISFIFSETSLPPLGYHSISSFFISAQWLHGTSQLATFTLTLSLGLWVNNVSIEVPFLRSSGDHWGTRLALFRENTITPTFLLYFEKVEL